MPLIGKVNGDEILLSGGLSQIKGITDFAKLALQKTFINRMEGQYFSAIGAALSY